MDDIDKSAWHAIQHWHDHAGEQVVYDGIDYTNLVKWYLWDKVGRFYRAQSFPADQLFELDCLRRYEVRCGNSVSSVKLKEYLKDRVHNLRAECKPSESKLRSAPRPSKLIFIPNPTTHIRSIGRILTEAGHLLVSNIKPGVAEFAEASVVSVRCRRKTFGSPASRLYADIVRGLSLQGVDLAREDSARLYGQLANQQRVITQAEAELDAVAPDLVLLVADIVTPYQEYLAAARKRGIPTLSFQHGMDCERYYLDYAYSSYYGVWSESRYDQFRAAHPNRPAVLQVTGNPHYDGLKLPASINTDGKFWLWITRPHRPKYCYAPSRRPSEGVEIFKTLIAALQTHPEAVLVVKPHHNDYADIYEKIAGESGFADRISIASERLEQLIPAAKLVISEDSTAAVESMFYGKIVVHAHFASCAPVLKLVDYAAALPGFSAGQLRESIERADRLTASEKQQILAGQRACLRFYAGPLDGMNSERQKQFILDSLCV